MDLAEFEPSGRENSEQNRTVENTHIEPRKTKIEIKYRIKAKGISGT